MTRRQYEGDVFAIKEYYTNKVTLARLDPGGLGRLAARPDPLHEPDRSTWGWPKATCTCCRAREGSASTS